MEIESAENISTLISYQCEVDNPCHHSRRYPHSMGVQTVRNQKLRTENNRNCIENFLKTEEIYS